MVNMESICVLYYSKKRVQNCIKFNAHYTRIEHFKWLPDIYRYLYIAWVYFIKRDFEKEHLEKLPSYHLVGNLLANKKARYASLNRKWISRLRD